MPEDRPTPLPTAAAPSASTDGPFAVGVALKGRYFLEVPLGRGAMAAIWRARDLELDRPVAVKAPLAEILRSTDDVDAAERFRREVRRLATLEHPHIVKLHDAGTHEGHPYAVLAFLEGGNLAERIARAAGSPTSARVASVARWLVPVAAALDFIHARGVVHRDVKPENVLFDPQGHAFLADFGLAKVRSVEKSLTPLDRTIGSPAYLAPETLHGEEPTGAFDQYSLATMVFEAIAGFRPFADGSVFTVLESKARKHAPSLAQVAPGTPSPVARAVDRALEADPRARFASCGELAAELSRSS